jgi:hypothetical protein
MSHCGLTIYNKKVSEGKRRIMEIQKIICKKSPKRTKILQDIITL